MLNGRSEEDVLIQWEKIKNSEKKLSNSHSNSSMDGITKHLPTLIKAQKIQQKANFDGLLPDGVEGTSYGEMRYIEEIWVSSETGQVADRELNVTVNFVPDPRLAVNFQATEALDSVIVYEGTLDGANITADRRTFSSGSIFTGTDNSTGADHVLDNFSVEEKQSIETVTNNIISSIATLIKKDLDLFSSQVNQK